MVKKNGMKHYVVLAMLVAFPAQADDIFSAQEKQSIMKVTLQKFWGQAVDSKGQPIMPKDDAERANLPITREQASYLIDKGAESAMAEWCNVAWEERFHLLMKQMRNNAYNETQLAYAGVLHGVAQGMTKRAVNNQKCDADTKQQITTIIKQDISNLKKSLKPA